MPSLPIQRLLCLSLEIQEAEEDDDEDGQAQGDQEEELGHCEGHSITKVKVYSVKIVILFVLISCGHFSW